MHQTLAEVTGKGRAKGEMRGMAGDSGRKEKEQSCSLGQIFCCFIGFSVNRLVFARTGTQGSVEERVRAQEERDQENGHHQLPGPSLRGHHLYKLFIIDLAVSVDVSLSDHLIHFLVGQLLTQVRHYMA